MWISSKLVIKLDPDSTLLYSIRLLSNLLFLYLLFSPLNSYISVSSVTNLLKDPSISEFKSNLWYLELGLKVRILLRSDNLLRSINEDGFTGLITGEDTVEFIGVLLGAIVSIVGNIYSISLS